VKGLTWQIAADGIVRFRTERGEFRTWLDPEQAEQLVSDLRQRQTWQPDPEYVPQPCERWRRDHHHEEQSVMSPRNLAINALVSTVLHAVNFEAPQEVISSRPISSEVGQTAFRSFRPRARKSTQWSTPSTGSSTRSSTKSRRAGAWSPVR
jgi:hypothetical protein